MQGRGEPILLPHERFNSAEQKERSTKVYVPTGNFEGRRVRTKERRVQKGGEVAEVCDRNFSMGRRLSDRDVEGIAKRNEGREIYEKCWPGLMEERLAAGPKGTGD